MQISICQTTTGKWLYFRCFSVGNTFPHCRPTYIYYWGTSSPTRQHDHFPPGRHGDPGSTHCGAPPRQPVSTTVSPRADTATPEACTAGHLIANPSARPSPPGPTRRPRKHALRGTSSPTRQHDHFPPGRLGDPGSTCCGAPPRQPASTTISPRADTATPEARTAGHLLANPSARPFPPGPTRRPRKHALRGTSSPTRQHDRLPPGRHGDPGSTHCGAPHRQPASTTISPRADSATPEARAAGHLLANPPARPFPPGPTRRRRKYMLRGIFFAIPPARPLSRVLH